MIKTNDPLSEHPLFRALVLMGGGLALSCGGVARTEPDPLGSSGAGSGASGFHSVPGASGATTTGPGGSATITIGGFTSDPGGSAAGGGEPAPLDCPTEQYVCKSIYDDYCGEVDLSSALAMGACVCDRFRPTSIKDCKPNENIFCRQGYLPGATPRTWDGSIHVQCACIQSPIPAASGNCLPACQQLLQNYAAPSGRVGCILPNPCTYDDSGVCTATSEDILYQDGIMCGCANITLK
ncbi:MAG: hypothetical protein ABJB12_10750 [Pseudomonadota bacterium]